MHILKIYRNISEHESIWLDCQNSAEVSDEMREISTKKIPENKNGKHQDLNGIILEI